MVTSSTWERRALFRNERWTKLLMDTIHHYRGTAYLLHEFVIMPDHFHVLITPLTSLEKAIQFIKGGFSFRAKKELGSNMEVWQKGFSDHRIRDVEDYERHVLYIRENPIRKNLCERAEDYPYSSAHSGIELDPVPQGLKPKSIGDSDGAAKAAPFQNTSNVTSETSPAQSVTRGTPKGTPLQNANGNDMPEDVTSQNPDNVTCRGTDGGTPEAMPFQNKLEDQVNRAAPSRGKSTRGVASGKEPPTTIETKIA